MALDFNAIFHSWLLFFRGRRIWWFPFMPTPWWVPRTSPHSSVSRQCLWDTSKLFSCEDPATYYYNYQQQDLSISLSLSFSLSFPFLYLSVCISSFFCLPSSYPFLIVFLNFLFLSLQLDYIPFFPISIIKLNKMVKECFKFIYKCQYSVYFHDDIFFLEWHSYSPWSVRDQLILSTSLSMYNPTLLLLCTQWMVGHIIDTWLNKFWWNQLSNSQNSTLKNPTIF